MVMPQNEGPTVFRARTLYREWGWRFIVIQNLTKAVQYFNKSIENSDADMNDLKTLLGLAVSFNAFTDYHNALLYVDKCMEIDPQNNCIKWMKVETLFEIGEFAYSLIHAHQGYRQWRFPYEWGICKGNETIENCIGRNTLASVLRKLFLLIKAMDEHRKVLITTSNEEQDEFKGIDKEQSKFRVMDPEVKLEVYLSKLQHMMAKTYLGTTCNDKHFIERLLQFPYLRLVNKKSGAQLCYMLQNCLKRLNCHQDVLRMRKPLYFFIFLRLARPPGHTELLRQERLLRKNNITVEANFLLSRLHQMRMERDYLSFFRFLERTKEKFDSYSSEIFPAKKKCLYALYNMIAWTYVDQRNLKLIGNEGEKVRHLKRHLGIEVGELLPRDIDIGWIPTPKKMRTMKSFRRKLALADDPLELSWLYHEFCKFLIEIHRFDLARFYVKKGRAVSIEVKNEQWILNTNHILIRIEIAQHNKNEAKEAALLALLSAKKMGVRHVIDFYKRVVEFIDNIDIEQLINVDNIATREKLIRELMPNELKTQIDFLFRTMNAIPINRRISVMPGCKPFNKKSKLSCKRKTIFQNLSKNPEKKIRIALLQQYAPSKKIFGWLDFQQYEY